MIDIYEYGFRIHKFSRREIIRYSDINPILFEAITQWRLGLISWNEAMEAVAMYFIIQDTKDREEFANTIKKMSKENYTPKACTKCIGFGCKKCNYSGVVKD